MHKIDPSVLTHFRNTKYVPSRLQGSGSTSLVHITPGNIPSQNQNDASQVSENPSRGLDFHVFLCPGTCQGTPRRPSRGGYSKKHEKTTFGDPPFGRHLGQMLTLFWLHFSHVFLDLFSSIFALVLAAIWLNFEGFWPQSRTPIEQIGKSENGDSV